MDRRRFLGHSGAAAAFAAGSSLFGVTNLLAAAGQPLRKVPELKTKGGFLKTNLIMGMQQFLVGDRTITVPAYNGSLPGPTVRVKPGDNAR